MATVTSLTASRILELVGGWEGVASDLNDLSGVVSSHGADLEASRVALQTLNEVTLPELQVNLAANQVALDDLNENGLPNLALAQQQNQAALDDLNTTILPSLNAEMDSNSSNIADLNDNVLPDLQTRLAQAETDIANGIGGFDPAALQAQLDANTASITLLTDTTLPALQTTLNNNSSALNTLNTTTLPDLTSRLGSAEGSVTGLAGRFPITGPDIAADAVTANKIAADAITAREIAAHAITAAEIAADSITANEIAANAITVNELAADSVTATQLAADAVTANKIAADAITAREIAADAITASELAANAVTANEIAANAVTAIKILAGEINSTHVVTAGLDANVIKFGTMSGDRITANTINSGHIVTVGLDAQTIKFGTMSGDRITANTINSGHIVTIGLDAQTIKFGTMSGDRITVNTINSNHIVTAGLDAQTIKFGTMSGDRITVNTLNGDRIVANSITASKVIIGDVGNMVRDPSADNLGTWIAHAAWTYVAPTTPSPNDSNSLVFRYTANNAYSQINEAAFPVSPGDRFFMEYMVRLPGLVVGSASIGCLMFFFDKNSTFLSAAGADNAATSLSTTWTQKTANIVVPANAAKAYVAIRATAGLTSGSVEFDQIDVRRQVTSTLLEPNLVLSSRIISGLSTTGARIELNTIGLQAFNAAGTVTAQISNDTGNVSIVGEFGTGTVTGPGVRISSSTFAGIYGLSTYPTVFFNNGSQAIAGNRQPQIFTDTRGNSNLYMWGGASNVSRMPQVKLDVGLVRLGLEATPGTNDIDGDRIQIANGQIDIIAGIVKTWGEHQVTGAVQCSGTLQTSADHFQLTGPAGANWKGITCQEIHSVGGGIWMDNLAQGSATGANIGADGRIVRTGSSLRYKEDIRPMEWDDARKALDLEPVTFLMKDDRHIPEDIRHRYPGFIAEQAADVGMDLWVNRLLDGQPDGFRYGELTSALLMIVKDQQARIEALEAK